MSNGLRLACAIPGMIFLLQGITWILRPAAAAEGLGMPLLDGLGRSTQVGDFAAFFLGLGLLISFGVGRHRPELLRIAALFLGLAALGRTLAWAFADADFATQFIAIEALMAALLAFGASKLDEAGGAPAT